MPCRASSSSGNSSTQGSSNGSGGSSSGAGGGAPPSNTAPNGKPLAPWALTFDLRERETLWTEVRACGEACMLELCVTWAVAAALLTHPPASLPTSPFARFTSQENQVRVGGQPGSIWVL